VTAIPLGRGSPPRLGATSPPAPRATSSPAYSVLLRVEIARFTRSGRAAPGGCSVPGSRPDRPACAVRLPACAGTSQNTRHGGPPRLVSVAL